MYTARNSVCDTAYWGWVRGFNAGYNAGAASIDRREVEDGWIPVEVGKKPDAVDFETAKKTFEMEGEEPLDDISFRCGYKAGAASVSRKEVVREAFTKVALELGRGELPEPNEFYYATSLATAMEKVLAEMEDNDAN